MTELLIIALVLIIFFGSKRMGQIAKHAGESTKELKKVKRDYDAAMQELDKAPKEEKE